MATVTVEVHSDIICPWCFVGHHRLNQALTELDPSGRIAVVHRPFLLDRGLPAGGTDLPAMLEAKYGVDAAQMFAPVHRAASESGLALDLTSVPKVFPTQAAHTLLRHALPLGTQRALVTALFAAYFQQQQDISSPAVLGRLAAAHGFDAAQAQALVTNPDGLAQTAAEANAAQRAGIRGVPFFRMGTALVFSGAQPLEVFRGAVRQMLEDGPQAHQAPSSN